MNCIAYHALLILAALLPVTVVAQSLSSPIDSSSYPPMAEHLPPAQAAELVAPAENWRQRAMNATAPTAGERTGRADLDLIKDGVALKLRGRDLAAELLEQIPNGRLKAAFEARNADQTYESNEIRARLRVAEEILSRSAMSADHAGAALERAQMKFLQSRTLEEARGHFAEFDFQRHESTEEAELATASIQALNRPESVEALQQSRELLDLAKDYRMREQQGWLASLALRPLRENGVESFKPSARGDDARPFLLTAGMAFEAWDWKSLKVIDEAAHAWDDLTPEEKAEVLYWPAMWDYSQSRYLEAINRFIEIDDLGVDSRIVAQSVVQLGDSFHMNRNYVNAATRYYDAVDRFSVTYPDIAAEAQIKFDKLIEAGLIDRMLAMTSFQRFQENRVANANVSENESEGN